EAASAGISPGWLSQSGSEGLAGEAVTLATSDVGGSAPPDNGCADGMVRGSTSTTASGGASGFENWIRAPSVGAAANNTAISAETSAAMKPRRGSLRHRKRTRKEDPAARESAIGGEAVGSIASDGCWLAPADCDSRRAR